VSVNRSGGGGGVVCLMLWLEEEEAYTGRNVGVEERIGQTIEGRELSTILHK
jgi:hypothetical protein